MKRFRSHGIIGLGLLFVLTACGGGGASSTIPPPNKPPIQSNGTTTVTLKIDDPKSGSTANGRSPKYISAATQSLAYNITGPGGVSVAGGQGYVNLTPGSSYCTSGGALQPLTCTTQIPISISSTGTYTFNVAAYDQPQTANCVPGGSPACVGNELSVNTLAQTLTLGAANTVSLTLGGVVSSYAMFVATPPTTASVTVTSPATLNIQELTSSPVQVTLVAFDPDGNLIVGPGSPVLTLTSSDGSSLEAGASATGTFAASATAGASTPNTFYLKSTASSVNNSVTLTVSAPGSPGTPPTLALPVHFFGNLMGIAVDNVYNSQSGTITTYAGDYPYLGIYDLNHQAWVTKLHGDSQQWFYSSVAIAHDGTIFASDDKADLYNPGGFICTSNSSGFSVSGYNNPTFPDTPDRIVIFPQGVDTTTPTVISLAPYETINNPSLGTTYSPCDKLQSTLPIALDPVNHILYVSLYTDSLILSYNVSNPAHPVLLAQTSTAPLFPWYLKVDSATHDLYVEAGNTSNVVVATKSFENYVGGNMSSAPISVAAPTNCPGGCPAGSATLTAVDGSGNPLFVEYLPAGGAECSSTTNLAYALAETGFFECNTTVNTLLPSAVVADGGTNVYYSIEGSSGYTQTLGTQVDPSSDPTWIDGSYDAGNQLGNLTIGIRVYVIFSLAYDR